MSSKQLVICDADTDYTARLRAFFCGKKELAFQVKICDSPQKLQEIKAESPDSMLLIHESFAKNDVLEGWQGKVIILSETKGTDSCGKWQAVFKYQSCGDFLTGILESCEKTDIEGVWRVRKSAAGRVIGIYSPVRRLGQTTFALEMAKELSGDANVLYLNLETYAGYEGYFMKPDKKSMSTLLYYVKQESANIGMVLATLVCQIGEVDYVPPVMLSEDLQAMTEKEWLWLFREIIRNSIYDVLILDLGESVQGLFEILKFCDDVYMPVADDRIAAAKIRQYEDNLREMGYAQLVERMIRCDIRRTITGKNLGKSGSVKRNRRRRIDGTDIPGSGGRK